VGSDFHEEEEKMKTYPCRCGGKTRLEYKQERTGDISIKGVPVLVCTRCGEEWYPPGVATMIEGIRETARNIDHIEVSAEKIKALSE
jgi:YgiT-type zinc finger domain-containing protein